MQGKPTSVRLTIENDSKIKAIAKREGITMGQLINRIIAEYSDKQGNEDNNQTAISIMSKEIMSRFENFEKELAMQRQRTNILKNQIDYIIKSQNGKGRTDKYSENYKPK